ncbi:MAG: hypothetical protein AAF697_04135 [Pseudomonadota bacterium]
MRVTTLVLASLLASATAFAGDLQRVGYSEGTIWSANGLEIRVSNASGPLAMSDDYYGIYILSSRSDHCYTRLELTDGNAVDLVNVSGEASFVNVRRGVRISRIGGTCRDDRDTIYAIANARQRASLVTMRPFNGG